MALIHCDFFSESLGLSTSMYVILPQKTQGQIGMTGIAKGDSFPVLYLLHGMSDDHSIWLRRTSIERYVAPLSLAVVMPAAGRSFYADMKHGYKYETFIAKELPSIVRSFFPISSRREDTFIAGLSMGGYGAFRLAMTYPEQYAAAASLSGVMDVLNFANRKERMADAFLAFGDPTAQEQKQIDIFSRAEELSKQQYKNMPLYQCCGTEDFLYQGNVQFRDHAKTLKLDLTYEEEPGTHEWGFWDKKIQSVLHWLPLKK
ncbi:MAG: esterase family protein [Spirochaetes bacterium]|nr:esterase family protein [Spirochaetota bacterium]